MGFDREDCYDEAKSYVQAIEMLDFIEDYWKYDLDEKIIKAIEEKCKNTIEFYEKKHYNRVLSN